ncbi:hypothetical protein AO498_16525 [Algoriphagus sanaruensis]|uniref:Uncharacterized protein n=1 Tax=Algoriphagus sanaruensis TaxID=1727163 RepID=A0A142ESF3_9BACT|nr:hypothetical protein AO498_16525 [Algoriphagus sanaruensis]
MSGKVIITAYCQFRIVTIWSGFSARFVSLESLPFKVMCQQIPFEKTLIQCGNSTLINHQKANLIGSQFDRF